MFRKELQDLGVEAGFHAVQRIRAAPLEDKFLHPGEEPKLPVQPWRGIAGRKPLRIDFLKDLLFPKTSGLAVNPRAEDSLPKMAIKHRERK